MLDLVAVCLATQQTVALNRLSCYKDGLSRIRLLLGEKLVSKEEGQPERWTPRVLQLYVWQTPIMLLNFGVALFVGGLLEMIRGIAGQRKVGSWGRDGSKGDGGEVCDSQVLSRCGKELTYEDDDCVWDCGCVRCRELSCINDFTVQSNSCYGLILNKRMEKLFMNVYRQFLRSLLYSRHTLGAPFPSPLYANPQHNLTTSPYPFAHLPQHTRFSLALL